MIRELVAAMLLAQNDDTTPWTGAATQEPDTPVGESQTRVIVLVPFRTNATKPCGPAASVTCWMACGPVAAGVQDAPSVELQKPPA